MTFMIPFIFKLTRKVAPPQVNPSLVTLIVNSSFKSTVPAYVLKVGSFSFLFSLILQNVSTHPTLGLGLGLVLTLGRPGRPGAHDGMFLGVSVHTIQM